MWIYIRLCLQTVIVCHFGHIFSFYHLCHTHSHILYILSLFTRTSEWRYILGCEWGRCLPATVCHHDFTQCHPARPYLHFLVAVVVVIRRAVPHCFLWSQLNCGQLRSGYTLVRLLPPQLTNPRQIR